MDDFDRYLDERGMTEAERTNLAVSTLQLDLGYQIGVRRAQLGLSASALEKRLTQIDGTIGRWERGYFGREMVALATLLVVLGARLKLVPENAGEQLPPAVFPVGEYVRAARQARGWTVGWLACLLGIPNSDLRRLERGDLPLTPEWAEELSRVFRRRGGVWNYLPARESEGE